jgi:hypothetical protein
MEDTDPDWHWTIYLPEFYISVPKVRKNYPSRKQSKRHIAHIIKTYKDATLGLRGVDYGIDAIEHSISSTLYLTPEDALANGIRSLYKELMRDRKSTHRKDNRH